MFAKTIQGIAFYFCQRKIKSKIKSFDAAVSSTKEEY